jgi:hypothetical protein
MKAMSISKQDETLVVQQWDPATRRLVSSEIKG